jgi:CheY-like chemotaxis protein
MSLKTETMKLETIPEAVTDPYLVFIIENKKERNETAGLYKKLKLTERVKIMNSGSELLTYLENNNPEFFPSLIVLGFDMSQMNQAATLLLLKENVRYKNIPILIYSATMNYQEEKDWLKMGATFCRRKRKTKDGIQQSLIEFISLADILHEEMLH